MTNYSVISDGLLNIMNNVSMAMSSSAQFVFRGDISHRHVNHEFMRRNKASNALCRVKWPCAPPLSRFFLAAHRNTLYAHGRIWECSESSAE